MPVEVLEVRLYRNGARVDSLAARNAQVFDGEAYVGWNERIGAGDSLDVSYDLTAPDWERIGDGDPWSTYGMSFRVEVDVRIDGERVTLDSMLTVSREPEVVT